MYEWFVRARAKNMPLFGPVLQAEALAIAKNLSKHDFKASAWKEICCENKDVNAESVSD